MRLRRRPPGGSVPLPRAAADPTSTARRRGPQPPARRFLPPPFHGLARPAAFVRTGAVALLTKHDGPCPMPPFRSWESTSMPARVRIAPSRRSPSTPPRHGLSGAAPQRAPCPSPAASTTRPPTPLPGRSKLHHTRRSEGPMLFPAARGSWRRPGDPPPARSPPRRPLRQRQGEHLAHKRLVAGEEALQQEQLTTQPERGARKEVLNLALVHTSKNLQRKQMPEQELLKEDTTQDLVLITICCLVLTSQI